ncbi:MAG: hypothetical protein PHE02_13645 [Lachnospiraceae bacterium]|nr:hypothetical protein [Lachnospiraceae bacterium]
MAPVFDSGNSMFWDCPCYPLSNDLSEIAVNSFKKKEIELLSYIQNPGILSRSRLPDREEIVELLQPSGIKGKALEGILTGYEKKEYLLEQFQNGVRLGRYAKNEFTKIKKY